MCLYACLFFLILSNNFSLSLSQPEHAAKVTRVLLEMKNSDVLKLLNSPNSLAVQDKSVQVLKEANARTSSDAVSFAKSARCLSY